MFLRLTCLAILIGFATAPSANAEARGADPVIARALDSLTAADRLDDFAAARALRRHVYRRLPVAAVEAAWITDEPIRAATTLSGAMDLFRDGERGVWCQAAAVMLARLYEAAGYRAWVTSFGDPDSLTHTVTLVEIAGRLYVQDAYFNLDYSRPDGSPLPYYELLARLAREQSPRVRQDLDYRLGLFAARRQAQEWSLPGLQREVACDSDGERCAIAMTLARFFEVYYKRDEVAAFLRRHGQPERLEFLMLHPLWTTGPHYPTPSGEASAIQKKVEAITSFAARG